MRDPGSIPGSGRCPGEGNGYPLKYSCLENSMDRGPWWAIVYGVTKSQTWLSDSLFHLSVFSLTIPKFTAWNYFYIEGPPPPSIFFLKECGKCYTRFPSLVLLTSNIYWISYTTQTLLMCRIYRNTRHIPCSQEFSQYNKEEDIITLYYVTSVDRAKCRWPCCNCIECYLHIYL